MEEKALDKILSNNELRALFELMDNSSWPLLEKVNKAMQEDWIEQTATANWASESQDRIVREILHRQGQIKGVTLFFAYLNKKRKALESKLEH